MPICSRLENSQNTKKGKLKQNLLKVPYLKSYFIAIGGQIYLATTTTTNCKINQTGIK